MIVLSLLYDHYVLPCTPFEYIYLILCFDLMACFSPRRPQRVEDNCDNTKASKNVHGVKIMIGSPGPFNNISRGLSNFWFREHMKKLWTFPSRRVLIDYSTREATLQSWYTSGWIYFHCCELVNIIVKLINAYKENYIRKWQVEVGRFEDNHD